MSDTLPWIIAGACALWAIVVTLIVISRSDEIKNLNTELTHERQEGNYARKWSNKSHSAYVKAWLENRKLRARIEAARKALEEEA